MISRLKFNIGNLIDEQFSYFPIYIWESDTTTFCDLNMAGGQFIQKVVEWLRKFGHSDENIKKRVFGFSEKPFYLSYIKSNPSLIGTFDVYNENITMKFDVQLGNDPYQTSNIGDKKTHAIWHKHLQKRISLLNDGGFLGLIHPSAWRNVDGDFKETQELIKSKKLLFLKMHGYKEGRELFGAQINFDMYVLQNSSSDGYETKIVHENGTITHRDLSNLEFIPSDNIDEIMKLVAKLGEEKVNILHSYSDYEIRKKHMNKEKTNEFKYPCVYTITKGSNINFWYSNTNQKGHFGIPKVIWSNGSATSPIIDKNGDFGITQFSYGIIDDVENLENIQKALSNPRFISDIMLFKGLADIYNYKIISTFRKDFWKEFIND